MTLGRDFCGVVVRKGMSVREELQVGDKVWGVVPLHRSGCHAEYVVVDESCVSWNEFDVLSPELIMTFDRIVAGIAQTRRIR